jgi:hypothetical protein
MWAIEWTTINRGARAGTVDVNLGLRFPPQRRDFDPGRLGTERLETTSN